MESARIAEPADLGAIEDLATRYADEVRDARGGALFLAREARIASLGARLSAGLDDDCTIIVVGCYDDVVLGYGLATVEQLADGRRMAVLEDILVEPEGRESGIGEAIMNLILGRVVAMGCFGIDSRALPGDRHTKNFFESFGLKARLLIMHRDLDDAPISPT